MGKSYYRLMFGIYGVSLALCGPLRIYLKLRGTDMLTGFYTTSGLPVTLFNLVLGAALVGMIILNRLRVTDHDYPILQKGRVSSILSLFVGGSIALFMMEATRLKTFTLHSGIAMQGISANICAVLGLLSALSFIWLGVCGLADMGVEPNGVAMLVPALWQTILIVARFNKYTPLTTISDNLLIVLFMAFCGLFIIGHARTVCGFSRRNGRNYLIPMGLITSLLGLVLTVPNYLYKLTRHTQLPAETLGDMECLYILLMSVYALAAVREMRKSIVVV